MYGYTPEDLSDVFSRTPGIKFLVELLLPVPKISFSEGKPLFLVVLSFVEIYDAQILAMPSSFLWVATAWLQKTVS